MTSKLTDKPLEEIDLEKDVFQAIKVMNEAKDAVNKMQDEDIADLGKLIDMSF